MPNWHVIDGDTIKQGDRVIRLWGIDAPEINQRCLNQEGSEYKCGQNSKEALELLIQNDPLICDFVNEDRYGREVAKCYHYGQDIGALMVSLGQAVDYDIYSKGYYSVEQFGAQKKELGLWQGAFENPKDYRQGRRGI